MTTFFDHFVDAPLGGTLPLDNSVNQHDFDMAMARLVSNPTDPAMLSELQMNMSAYNSQLGLQASIYKIDINNLINTKL
jgi:hypothetical protein